jgi:dihydrofolate reductase
MLLVIKLVGFLVCAGILAFGGVKTVQEVKIDEMISEIDTVVENTPFFPEIDPAIWQCISQERHEADEKHAYAYTFAIYKRKS